MKNGFFSSQGAAYTISVMLKSKDMPKKPGVYLYKDAAGQIIYIGKAKSLRNRVRSYFASSSKDAKTVSLVKAITDIEYIITHNELEALILESILIKKHIPRYNIRLRDDKNYQFIKIDYSMQIPQVYSVRKKNERSLKNAKYFGPYTSGLSVRYTLRLIKKIFPYCTAEKIGKRPCFNFQLHRCPGVCIGLVSRDQYKAGFKQIEVFLQGQTRQIEKTISKDMLKAAKTKHFEKAAAMRDQLDALRSLKEHQKIISIRPLNHDYIGVARRNDKAVVNLFIVRDGRLTARENATLENVGGKSDSEIFAAFIERYYLDATNLPNVLFLPAEIEDKSLYEKLIVVRAKELGISKYKIKIKTPRVGTAKELVKLANENAQDFLEQQYAKFEKEETIAQNGLLELQKLLNLKGIPKRIEGYDISNISGKYAVGSMVVMVDGKPAKQQYRKFKIKGPASPNDYAMMQEVLTRRIHNDWPKADLWVVDGGRGQLGVALEVKKKFKLSVPVVALAKDRRDKNGEKIFIPKKSDPIMLPEGSSALLLIQRLRDEAHRFAITYHRDVRSRGLF